MISQRMTKIETSFSRYIAKRSKSGSMFKLEELTKEKIALTQKFLSAINVQQSNLQLDEFAQATEVRNLLLKFRMENAALEFKHGMLHLSSSQIRKLGKNILVAKYESTVTQSTLNTLIEHHLDKIEITSDQFLVDSKFIILTFARMMDEKLNQYIASLTAPCGPLTLEKSALVLDASSILTNIINNHLPKSDDATEFLNQLQTLVTALHNSNAALEKKYGKHHVSFVENREKGMGIGPAFFNRTFFQSRLNLLTESFSEIIKDIAALHAVECPKVFQNTTLEHIDLHLPEALALIPERSERPLHSPSLISINA